MPSAAAGPRILVVDDDPMLLELLTVRLDLAGYQAHGARNGREALDRVRDERFAAMVLDINMPEIDGFEVLRRLGTQGVLAALPVMVLTARHDGADVRAAVQLGARDFMAKPFDDRLFLQRIARLLRSARPREA